VPFLFLCRFCVYPQELGFEIDADGALLTQIQVLSHQFKIAKRIEIYVGFGPDYLHAEFKRLGCVLCARIGCGGSFLAYLLHVSDICHSRVMNAASSRWECWSSFP
jgi:hypothetical protein